MHIETTAIVCALLPHGEHGAVLRALTPDHGLVAGYVRGGRSRRLRPVLQPGNVVAIDLRARVDSQLAAATVELVAARAALAVSGASVAALDWLTSLTAAALVEAIPATSLHAGLDALTAAIAAGAAPAILGEGVVRYELRRLAELGLGLDLASCVATGSRDDLAYVSPKSRQAVSRGAGLPYAPRLLPLPAFLRGGDADASAIADGLALTGHFLDRDVLAGRSPALAAVRQRFVARLAG